MTDRDLTAALYEKMSAEQKWYRGWLLLQTPEEILHHACEYTVREDILMALESHALSNAQAKALLRSPTPLADVYREWEKSETNHMDDVRAALKSRANFAVCQQKEAGRLER